jgi:hypothetical protein
MRHRLNYRGKFLHRYGGIKRTPLKHPAGKNPPESIDNRQSYKRVY